MKSVASLRLPVERLLWNTWKLSGVTRGNFERYSQQGKLNSLPLQILVIDCIRSFVFMPVFGHAFIGLGAAQYTRPQAGDSIGAALWVAIVVFLNYLPDIVSQLCLVFGLHGVETIAHSLSVAIALSLIMAAVLMVLARISFRRAFLISFCSMLVHDLLDLIYVPERNILWPFINWRPGSDYSLPPLSLIDEILIFGSLYFVSWLMYRLWFEKHGGQQLRCSTPRQQYLGWLSRIAVIIVIICAGTTHYLQKIRGEQFKQAKVILQTTRNYAHALDLLNKAGSWPYGATLTWINYFKARTSWSLGNTRQAERYYQESLAEDPLNFWSIGDLALLYASGAEDTATRRSKTEPYVVRLRTHYADNPFVSAYLKKIEIALRNTADADHARSEKTHPPLSLY